MIDNDLNEIDMKEGAKGFLVLFIALMITIFICIIIGKCNEHYEPTPTIPIEEMKKIDSINNIIIDKEEGIIKLDSIKNDTIKKVKTLTNDSTIDLFRKLVYE